LQINYDTRPDVTKKEKPKQTKQKMTQKSTGSKGNPSRNLTGIEVARGAVLKIQSIDRIKVVRGSWQVFITEMWE
jgi:hypothetical protein